MAIRLIMATEMEASNNQTTPYSISTFPVLLVCDFFQEKKFIQVGLSGLLKGPGDSGEVNQFTENDRIDQGETNIDSSQQQHQATSHL